MKFSVPQTDMFKVLSQITGVLERTQTRDILSHARVSVTDSGELTMSCTDITMTMVAQLEVEHVEEPGGASIPGLRLFDIFRKLPSDEAVTFETAEEMINITAGRSEFRLNVMTGPNSNVLEGYAAKPPDDHIQYTITAAKLREMLMYTNSAMGTKEARRYMVATCFELNSEHFRTVSTEASILAMATFPNGVEGLDETKQYVVPRKTVLQVTSMCTAAAGNEQVKLTFGSNHFSASIGMFTLTSNLLDTKYPVYQNVFPDELSWTMVCDREGLRDALERAEVVAVDASHRVVLDCADDVLTMRAASTRNDRVETGIALDVCSSERKVSINGERVLRILSNLKGARVEFTSDASDLQANIKVIDSQPDEKPAGASSDAIDITYLMATMSDR
ncbi:MAG: DNA polymerase III subunit beta [Gammaproteobacteria bacterium]|nr:DNA polymerase III subunit beta [Gammaproteobacteria bacterium]